MSAPQRLYAADKPGRSESWSSCDLVCWSRMQAEAGQGLEAIIQRKEIERRVGDGLFCWGVGNAPAVAANALARLGETVAVVFSIMKGRPKPVDARPARVVAWRRYFDLHGALRELPPHMLVTSRADGASGPKTRHFALMCQSDQPLALERGVSFDPSAYRNVGGAGAPVGASQVTALLRKTSPASTNADYEANLRAWLAESYWVRLADPVECAPDFSQVDALVDAPGDEWIEFVARARSLTSRRSSQLQFCGQLI